MARLYDFEVWLVDSGNPNLPDRKIGDVTVPVLVGDATSNINGVVNVDYYNALTNIELRTDETQYVGNGIGHATGSFDDYMQPLKDIAPYTAVWTDIFPTTSGSTYHLKIINKSGYYLRSTYTVDYAGASLNEYYDNQGNMIISYLPFSGVPFYSNTQVSNMVVTSIENGELTGDIAFFQVGVSRITLTDTLYMVGHTRVTNAETKQKLMDWWNGCTGRKPDPYGDGSDEGGGDGSDDNEDGHIGHPTEPTLEASDTGFLTLFAPTVTQLQNLASYMWSGAFDLNNFKKIFADPMDAILGMSIVPFSVNITGTREVKVGNISTGINMNEAKQWKTIDCGTVTLGQIHHGSFLDFDPYTKFEIYLPFCGTHALSADDVVGNTLSLQYIIDCLSGACIATLQCIRQNNLRPEEQAHDSVLYTFSGQCSVNIPITGNDWSNTINGAISIAASIGSMVATGGASAPMAIPTIASTAVNSMKPTIEKSGSISGASGLMGIHTPYLIRTTPRECVPSHQSEFIGYPSFVTRRLSALSGYTEVESIHLENTYATDNELDEINSLLSGGVIL